MHMARIKSVMRNDYHYNATIPLLSPMRMDPMCAHLSSMRSTIEVSRGSISTSSFSSTSFTRSSK